LGDHIVQMNTDFVLNKGSSFYYEIFRNSMIGQVIVNKNLDIISANNQIFQCFQSEFQDTAGLSFGNVYNCMELKHDCLKCGEAENCKNCGIWSEVQQILFNNAEIQSVIQYSFKIGDRYIKKWFQLNGAQMAWPNERYATLAFIDISALKQQEEQLKFKLTLDLATGTMNKSSLMATLRKLMESGEASGSFTICMIDFDNFKVLNDQYGHLMGDKVLEVFSDIAQCHIRKNDILGRYGGEEFIFVFYGTDQRQSLQILKRIHNELEEYFAKDIEIPVTFSAGAIYVEAVNGLTPYTDLLGDVDKMLYRAKRRGRGRAISSMGETLFTSSGI